MIAAPPMELVIEPRPWRRALSWLLFLGPFFFLSYGFATWAAAQRAGLPSIVFAWEHALPFWPWTILPYWSIDVLYGLSLFVCSSRRELDTHAKRLLTAQIVAVAFFLLVPLRFSFTQPATDGVWGALFAMLAQFDQPFNQLPSLHIALAAILWSLYARKLSGFARIAMTLWFLLIGISVLTTYQHHFIDIPTGLLLGLLCMWAWPFADEGDGQAIASQWRWTSDRKRWRVATAYAAVAVALALLVLAQSGWALWFMWAAVSLLLVATAYAGIGAIAFQKRADGRVSLASLLLFAPYRVGAWLNSRAWTFRAPHPVAIADGVYLGRVPGASGLAITGVVDLTAEFALRVTPNAIVAIPILDLIPPDGAELARAIEAIERLRAHGPVLVCCALGASRSACAVAAWLLATGRAPDVASALATLRAARSRVVIHAGHMAALAALATEPGRGAG